MRFRLCEEADTILQEAEQDLMTKPEAGNFGSYKAAFESDIKAIEEASSLNFAGVSKKSILDLIDNLKDICDQLDEAEGTYSKRNSDWEDWKRDLNNHKNDFEDNPGTRKKFVTTGKSLLNQIYDKDGRLKIYSPQQYKKLLSEIHQSYKEVAKIIKRLSDENKDDYLQIFSSLHKNIKNLLDKADEKNTENYFNTRAQSNKMKEEFNDISAEDLSGLDNEAEEDDEENPHQKTVGAKQKQENQKLIARIKALKYTSQDEKKLVELLSTASKGANKAEDFKKLLPLIIDSIRTDGIGGDNFILSFILKSKAKLGDIPFEQLSLLRRYEKQQTDGVTGLDENSINVKNTPWFYSKSFYDQFPTYKEFKNAVQALELLRNPDRVKQFIGSTKDSEGNKIDAHLIYEGDAPNNIRVKPLNEINATINKLSREGTVSRKEQRQQITGKEEVSKSSRTEDISFTSEQINNAKKYVQTIDANKKEIENLPKDLQNVLNQARAIFSKVT